MASSHTILVSNLHPPEETIVRGVLPTLTAKTGHTWDITKAGRGSIAIVDVDSEQGLATANLLEKRQIKVVRLSLRANESSVQGHWLQKPLRSTEVLRCIHAISLSFTTDTDQQEQDLVVRLRRWPSKDIIRDCPGSSRLFAILIRNALSIKNAAKVSGMPLDQVILFVNKCRQSDCIDIVKGQPKQPAENITSTQKSKYSNLFSRLRQKISGAPENV